MAKKLVLANWKMNLSASQSIRMGKQLADELPGIGVGSVELVLAPSYLALWPLKDICAAGGIGLSGQDLYPDGDGPCCGAVSASLLKGICEYVVIGHSERRRLAGESDELINRKIHAAVSAGLKPVLCVGETLHEKNLRLTESSLTSQLCYALEGIHEAGNLTLLYEPVWALGSGRSLSGEGAADMAFFLRGVLSSLYGASEASRVRIIYAGSVTPQNAADFACRSALDGVALGSSALSADKIMQILTAFAVP